jgi:hypothetical protein
MVSVALASAGVGDVDGDGVIGIPFIAALYASLPSILLHCARASLSLDTGGTSPYATDVDLSNYAASTGALPSHGRQGFSMNLRLVARAGINGDGGWYIVGDGRGAHIVHGQGHPAHASVPDLQTDNVITFISP